MCRPQLFSKFGVLTVFVFSFPLQRDSLPPEVCLSLPLTGLRCATVTRQMQNAVTGHVCGLTSRLRLCPALQADSPAPLKVRAQSTQLSKTYGPSSGAFDILGWS